MHALPSSACRTTVCPPTQYNVRARRSAGHQATIYFLTSKAEVDAPMRNKAPLMFVAGLLMVLLQIASSYALIVGMMSPACVSNAQCTLPGFFCYVPKEEIWSVSGRCGMCGQYTPLVVYRSDTETFADPKQDGKLVKREYNVIWDQSYPRGRLGKRSRTPDYAVKGVYNFSMVAETCTPPVKPFDWDFERLEDKSIVITDRTNVPAWLEDSRIDPILGDWQAHNHWAASSVARWCDACTTRRPPEEVFGTADGITVSDASTGLTVSIMNGRLIAMMSVDAMAPLDWAALLLCAYIVGLQIVGEIKDVALCEMQERRNAKELSPGWLLALNILNRLRSQLFLAPLMGCIPSVVLTQGGSALNIAFNTIAVLFITEVDNVSFFYG